MGKRKSRNSRIVSLLRQRILRGVYEEKLPSMRALAAELGVSLGTVYVAVAQLEVQGLVRLTQRRGAFVALRGKRSEKRLLFARIALQPAVDDETGMMEHWAAGIVYGFQQACEKSDIHMVLEYAIHPGEAIDSSLRESSAIGCVGSCLVGMDVNVVQALWLMEARGPSVVTESEVGDQLLPSLSFDHRDAGRQLAEHLVKIGHRRLAFVVRGDMSGNGRIRLESANEFLAKLGLKPCEVIAYPEQSHPALDKMLGRADRPTGVILERGVSSELLMVLAARHGIRVPEDMSVIAYDGANVFHEVTLTLIAGDQEAIGRASLEALLDENLQANPRKVLFPVKLVDRGTTAPPPAQ